MGGWLQGEVLERQLNYWRLQLAGAPTLLSLPTDRPRSAIQDTRGASYSFNTAPELMADLQKLGQRAGVTLFMTLLAAFQVFLCRYCSQDDIVVGTPITNRPHKELEDLIGFFVNTLVLRTDLSHQPSFLEVLQRVRQVVLDAITHQDIPFEQIVEALQPERDLGRSPLFQVMFVLQNASQEELDLSPLVVSELEIEESSAKFDLTLALTQSSGGLAGEFVYNSHLFERETIARMAQHFQVLLAGLVHEPTRPIETLPLLSQEQYKQIVLHWNATTQPYPQHMCIHQVVEEQARRTPQQVAVVYGEQAVSYEKLDAQANQLAHYLQRLGVGPEVAVGVCMERSIEMVVAILGILKAGGAYVPLDPAYPQERLAFMVEDAQIRVLVTQQMVEARFEGQVEQVVWVEQVWVEPEQESAEPVSSWVRAQNLAYIIYTSGSTGKPKGVCCHHTGVLNLIADFERRKPLATSDHCSLWTSISFDVSVYEIFSALCAGRALYLVREAVRSQSTAFFEWLQFHHIHSAYIPPFMLTDLVDWLSQGKGTLSLQRLLVGVEPIQERLLQDLLRWVPGLRILNGYGPTEATVCVTLYDVKRLPPFDRTTPLGRPMSNVRIYLLNNQMQPVPTGVPGEIYIGGAGLSRGYLRRPELTAECFVPDPFSGEPGARLYRTGDLGRYHSDGQLEFLGRRDHQVKIRGFRIELGEIEKVMLSYPGVHEAIVVVNESLPGEKRLVAYVVPDAGASPTKEGLQRFLKERLPDYMLPSALSFIERLPMTSQGKIDRSALAMRRLVTLSAPKKYVAPRDAVELQLAHLWERLLGVSPISVTENFFQLGGHSLAGVRLMSQIQRVFGLELPLSTLFQGATIASLATILRHQGDQPALTPLVAIQPEGRNAPLFCIHPSGGEVLCYTHLARHLGTEQPVYGLQSADLHHRQGKSLSLKEIAATYREAICALQPQGPYFLAGWSMGGVIAFEMARQFEAEGQHVSFLGFFDSYLPSERYNNDERTLLDKFVSDLAGMADSPWSYTDTDIATASSEELLQQLLLTAQQANILPPEVDVSYIKRLFTTFKKNIEALCTYQPEPYVGQITLFQASAFRSGEQMELTYGWRQFATAVTHRRVPGNHYSMLLDPQVEVLARQVLACIREHA